MFRFRSLLPASVLMVAFVAACSGAGSTPAPTTAPATAAPTTAPATAAPTLAFTVSLAPAGFFVGSTAMTLYTFDKDTANTSNCQTAPCVTNWPALVLQGGVQLAIGAGLPAAEFTTIARQDGTMQVTFNEVPLYYFAGDTKVGDKNGDGVGGIWHLATKDSKPPTPPATPSAATTTAPSAPASVLPTTKASPAGSPAGAVCYDAKYQVIPCPSASTAAGSPAASGSTVAVSSTGYLVDSTGMALYEYDKDTTPNTSACTADCATNWPALTVATGASVTAGDGVAQEDFATFTRSDDGASQVTYYGKPLYTFAGDTAAGDTNGANVSPSWHLAMPQ